MCVCVGVTSMFFITADGILFPFLGRALVLGGEMKSVVSSSA